MSDMDETGKPKLTPEILLDLHRQGNISATEAATARGDYASLLKSKQETHGLNLKAFKMASTIRKMENGKREHFFRDLLTYCDMMDVNQQKDILDTMADNAAGRPRSDLDAAMDGEPRERATEPDDDTATARVNAPLKPSSPMGKHTINGYRDLVEGLTDREAINTGLERFCADHPKLADEATMIVKDRLRRLGEEQGGGEDLRSTAQRDGEQAEVEQAGQAGKRSTRSRKGKEAEAEQPASVH